MGGLARYRCARAPARAPISCHLLAQQTAARALVHDRPSAQRVLREPRRQDTRAGPIARWLLRGRRTKHFMRTLYALNSAWRLKRSLLDGASSKDYWQAGKSVAGITSIEPAGAIVRRFAAAALTST